MRKAEKGHIRITSEYNNRLKTMRKLGYLDQDNKLTERGHFLINVYSYELLVGEIFSTDIWKAFDPQMLLVVAAAIIYEERRKDKYVTKGGNQIVQRILDACQKNDYVMRELDKVALRRLAPLITRWASGAEFDQLLELTDSQEGDIIHLFRRTLDLLRQVKHAAHDEVLRDNISKAMALIDRDIIQVSL